MIDDTDFSDAGGARGAADGGRRDVDARASRPWASEPARTAQHRPAVLVPENPWVEHQWSPYKEERRRSARTVVLLVVACVLGVGVFYTLRRSHRRATDIIAPATGETARAASPAPTSPVAPQRGSAELEIGGALPAAARVTVNGSPLDSQRVMLDSGTYVVRVSAPGYDESSATLHLSAGRITVWTPHLARLVEMRPEPPSAPPTHPPRVARTAPAVARDRIGARTPGARTRTGARVPARPRASDVASTSTYQAPSAPVSHMPPAKAASHAPMHETAVPSEPPSSASAAEGNATTCAAAYGAHDWDDAVSVCQREARAGSASAERSLGVMYDAGFGVAQDHVEAARWFSRAAAAGSRDAEYQLGMMYWEGRGLQRNEREAVRWFQQAALQGDANGEAMLGFAYEQGSGVAKSYSQAMSWFRKAAEHGDHWAENHIGWMYANGEGVEIDYAEAVTWFRRAADGGDAEAQYNLGYMYLHGFGVKRSLADAATWYRRAAAQGNTEARRTLVRWGVEP